MGRSALASGELGQHNGLPATIIVSTPLQDLQSDTGVGVTAGGTLLPMRDVIRLASQSKHYLVISDKHTRQPLYCGRAKRFGPDNRLIEVGGWTTRNAKMAAPNGSHHHTSTPAKRESTTTTTPRIPITRRRRACSLTAGQRFTPRVNHDPPDTSGSPSGTRGLAVAVAPRYPTGHEVVCNAMINPTRQAGGR